MSVPPPHHGGGEEIPPSRDVFTVPGSTSGPWTYSPGLSRRLSTITTPFPLRVLGLTFQESTSSKVDEEGSSKNGSPPSLP